MKLDLSDEEKKYFLSLARKAIADRLNLDYSSRYLNSMSKYDKEKFGVFVTLTENNNLRGCIGYVIGVEPLKKAIIKMAQEAAFNDPRFHPLERNEFEKINIEISILSPMERVKDLNEIKIGRDGLLIRKGFYSGLLLPQVAVEYNMDRKTFLEHVCLKAGLPKDSYKDKDVELFKFSAYIFSEKDFK